MLSTVEFHVAVADPVQHALRILRKARQSGVRLLVTAPADVLARLSSQMWSAQEIDFNPHALVGQASQAALQRSPVWLAQAASGAAHEPLVLLNLGQAVPNDLWRLQRLVEVVAADPASTNAGRQRWRQYDAAGIKPAKVFDGNAAGPESSSVG